MITGTGQNYSYAQFINETFGDLSVCNFELARFEGCVFTGAVNGCNFRDAEFTACSFVVAVFTGCNFDGAAGVVAGEITGEANNFEDVA